MNSGKLNSEVPKRVLMIAQSNYDYDARIIRFCDMLNKQNFAVDIICLRKPEQKKFEVIGNVNVFRIMKHFNQDTILSYILNSLLFLLSAALKSISLLLKNKYMVVHVHNMPDYLIFSAIFAKIKGIPVILDIHDLVPELFKEKWNVKANKLVLRTLTLSEKLSNQFADHTITVSDECSNRLKERGIKENKITVIMNVPNQEHFPFFYKRAFSKNSFNLIYHGTIAERYGLHHAINAIALTQPMIPVIKFFIVGKIDSEYADYLRRLSESKNISEIVIFKNSINYKDLSEFFKNMDLGIITETTLEYSEFGIPTKAFEYVATGLPIIINDLKITRSIFSEKSVCFIDYNNYKQIAEKILFLYNNPDKRKEMSLNAYSDLSKISYEKMSLKYINLLADMNNKLNRGKFNVQKNSYSGTTH